MHWAFFFLLFFSLKRQRTRHEIKPVGFGLLWAGAVFSTSALAERAAIATAEPSPAQPLPNQRHHLAGAQSSKNRLGGETGPRQIQKWAPPGAPGCRTTHGTAGIAHPTPHMASVPPGFWDVPPSGRTYLQVVEGETVPPVLLPPVLAAELLQQAQAV